MELSGAEWYCQKRDKLTKVDKLILLHKRPEVVVGVREQRPGGQEVFCNYFTSVLVW